MADLTEKQKAAEPSRRAFLERLGGLGATSVMLAHAPWLITSVNGALAQTAPSQKVRLGIIGVGSRGLYLLNNAMLSPSCTVVGVCDDYAPHLERAVAATEGAARGFADYRALLDWGEFDAVVIATPLYLHAEMTLASFDAGKHVLCEKSMARTIPQAVAMINRAHQTQRVLQIGHQRMFSPHYIEIAQQVHEGRLGKVVQVHSYWRRNGDWRREAPPGEERRFNWRVYREYSGGLCTELASHQIQIANWLFQDHPTRVSGSGDIAYWKDGREVHDHIALVYDYSDGRKHVWDSLCSNRYYGCEEQIMGDKGTIEAEVGDFYPEEMPPVPGLQQLMRDVRENVFNTVQLGRSSYQGERKSRALPQPIVSRHPPPTYEEGVHQFEAFAEAVRRGRAMPGLLPEAFNATVAALLGEQTAFTRESQNWPEFPDLIEGALA